nr:MAG TPA: 4Fe-4S single cluster domain protein [Caudoviricetes sp.]
MVKREETKSSKMNIICIEYSMSAASLDIFFSGCNAQPKCPGCYNTEAWDFNVGKDWKQWIFQINDNILKFGGMIKAIRLFGGEPLDQDPEQFSLFVSAIKEYRRPLWLFTRYELDEIDKDTKEQFDYIKTGPYKWELTTDDNISYGVKLATFNQKVNKKGIDY